MSKHERLIGGKRARGALKRTVEQVQALQKDAKSEAEAVQEFLSFFQECVKKCPSLFIACENPLVELGMIELAAARADPSFVSLAHTAAALSGGGKQQQSKDVQRFVAMDVISFACGLLPQSAEHKLANSGRWAALKEYLIANGNKEPSYVDKVSLYPPGSAPWSLDHDATNMGWMFGNALCLLALRFGAGGGGQGYPPMQPMMMGQGGAAGMNPQAYQQMMYYVSTPSRDPSRTGPAFSCGTHPHRIPACFSFATPAPSSPGASLYAAIFV